MLIRKLIITEDGSHSFYIEELGEQYHSVHGAVQESLHIYINAGLANIRKSDISIFEMGFGTGLNALLSFDYAKRNNKIIHYSAVEKYPLTKNEYCVLNYSDFIDSDYRHVLNEMHNSEWGTENKIGDNFTLIKYAEDIKNLVIPDNLDICYFDAFNPVIQPELWSKDIFSKIYERLNRGGILCTYSAKGIVKENLRSVGFKVNRMKGPEGKKHILQAIKV